MRPADSRNPSSKAVSARVESRGGRATLLINDEPHAPLLYALTDCPGARWTWEEIPSRNIALFAAQGCRLFQADIWLEQLLSADDAMDFTLVRRQVAGILDACPDARVMLRVHLNPPPAWADANPDECCAYADGPATPETRWGFERWLGRDNEGPIRASIYSDKWREWARRQLARFCKGLAASPEGAAIFSLQVAFGVYGEWHQWGFFCHEPDSSPAANAAFRRWLQRRYGNEAALSQAWHQPGITFAAVRAPDPAQRESSAVAMVRDPAKQRWVVDYFTFLHDELAEAVISMARVVRESWPRPIATATFFGYFYCMFGREAAGGHLAFDRIIAAREIDIVCATPAYTPTALPIGGAGNSRGIVDAVRRAGKLWLDEMDRATSVCGCPWDRNFSSTLPEDAAVLRRNLLQPATRGGGAWCYDFGPICGTPAFARLGNIGWWDEPSLQKAWGEIRALVQSRAGRPFERPSDVLLLHDPWAFAHLASRRHVPEETVFGVMPVSAVDPVSSLLTDGVVEALHQSGVIHTDALLSELPRLDLTPYRLVILATMVVLDASQRASLRDKVAVGGRHVAILGYGAWSDGEKVGPELATALSGIATRLHRAPLAAHTLELEGVSEALSIKRAFDVPAFEGENGEIVGRWQDGAASAVRRKSRDATWWTFGLPPTKPSTWRAIARAAGCHVINDVDETTLLGDGMLIVHTLTGGKRTLRLPGGRAFEATLPPRSTTVFDVTTGAILLG